MWWPASEVSCFGRRTGSVPRGHDGVKKIDGENVDADQSFVDDLDGLVERIASRDRIETGNSAFLIESLCRPCPPPCGDRHRSDCLNAIDRSPNDCPDSLRTPSTNQDSVGSRSFEPVSFDSLKDRTAPVTREKLAVRQRHTYQTNYDIN